MTLSTPINFNILKKFGCGGVMLAALAAMYCVKKSILGTAVVTATRGVRRGLSTSCFLFIIFLNELIKLIINACQPEPFLEWMIPFHYLLQGRALQRSWLV